MDKRKPFVCILFKALMSMLVTTPDAKLAAPPSDAMARLLQLRTWGFIMTSAEFVFALKKWLTGEKHLRLSQKTHIRYPTLSCYSGSRGSDTLFWLPWAYTYMCIYAEYTDTHIKIK